MNGISLSLSALILVIYFLSEFVKNVTDYIATVTPTNGGF